MTVDHGSGRVRSRLPEPLAGRSVTVLGSGVIGLTSALELRAAGAQVEIVSSSDVPMASTAACAFWLPAWGPGPAAGMLGQVADRTVVESSWRAYQQILDGHGQEAGLRAVTNREFMDDDQVDPPRWLQDLLTPSSIEEVDFGFDGRTYSRLWTFDSVVLDMQRHMDWLRRRARRAGVTFREALVTSLDPSADGPKPDLIVHCSGLGARRLAGDETVTPVRGCVVHLEAPPHVLESLKAVAIDEYYLIPRLDDVVVGGLVREEDDPNTTVPRVELEDEFELMTKIDTLSELAGADSPTSLKPTGRTSVGFRPRRVGGYRLEMDRSRPTPVLHNYGHGGNGVTLAWGCAERAVELATRELTSRGSTSPR